MHQSFIRISHLGCLPALGVQREVVCLLSIFSQFLTLEIHLLQFCTGISARRFFCVLLAVIMKQREQNTLKPREDS